MKKKHALLIPLALLASEIAKGYQNELETIVLDEGRTITLPKTTAISDSLIQETYNFLTDSLGLQGYIADSMFVYLPMQGRNILAQVYVDKGENPEMVKNLGVIVSNSNLPDSLAVVNTNGVYFPINRNQDAIVNANEFYKRIKDLPLGIIRKDETPSDYKLKNPYPNPSNSQVVIPYEIPKRGKVSLVVYDMNGKVVKRLVNKISKTQGTYKAIWDGTNQNGTNVASGVYICRMWTANGISQSTKLTLLK